MANFSRKILPVELLHQKLLLVNSSGGKNERGLTLMRSIPYTMEARGEATVPGLVYS